MSATRRLAGTVVVIAVAVASGCGDDGASSSTPVAERSQQAYARAKQANIRAGDASCTKLKQALKPLAGPLTDAAAAVKLVPAAIAAYGRAEQQAKRLRELPYNPADPKAGVIVAYRFGFAEQQVALDNYQRALQRGDPDLLRGSIIQFPQVVATQERNAREYGFKVCSDLGVSGVRLPAS